jgi:hypothetical protein
MKMSRMFMTVYGKIALRNYPFCLKTHHYRISFSLTGKGAIPCVPVKITLKCVLAKLNYLV